jgi:hypothetical protein
VTTVPGTPTEESSLPDAVDQLHAAIGALLDPIKEMIDGAVLAAASPYDELVAEIPAKPTGDAYSRGVGKSRPTVWVDAMDLKNNIDSRTKQMQPHRGSTPDRLRALASRKWRPQDVRQIRDHTAEIQSWRLSIRSLIEPEHVKQISAPCPSCSQRWVYRRDAGEVIRRPALSLIISQGCSCGSCQAFWPPQRYLFLCRLLGLSLPPGVVEEMTEPK